MAGKMIGNMTGIPILWHGREKIIIHAQINHTVTPVREKRPSEPQKPVLHSFSCVACVTVRGSIRSLRFVSAITSEPLPSIAMQPVCVGDDQLTELAAQLKPSRGPAPKTEMVKAALALARDPSLVAAAVAPKGGHDRARKLSLRILELGLLPAAAPPATAPPTAPPATAPDADEAENKPPQAATADVMTERKLKHAEARPCSQAEAQGRYMAKQRARQEREAYSRDWLELTKAEQAAASCFGFATCELWEDRLNRSAHSFSAEGHAIDLQGDKWLLPWANLTTEDRAATRMYILLHRVLHHRVLLYRVLHIEHGASGAAENCVFVTNHECPPWVGRA